ncbi:hypothetical protein V6N13_129663 [Hibiscus sabdariffa]
MCPPGKDVSQNGNIKTLESVGTIFEAEDPDVLQILERARAINVERNRSFEERIDHFEGLSPHGRRSGFNTPGSHTCFETQAMVAEAWENLRRSTVYYRSQPVGTIAAMDHSVEELNYDQVFVRDFVPSALAFLMNGEEEIVKNFLLKTLHLQSWEKRIDQFKLGEGVMPASFKVIHNPVTNCEILIPDFGESAIGRVAPVDSGFWWIILLRAYTKHTGDSSLAELPDCQRGMRLILSLCLSEAFDTFPTLLCADGCCMIDRRMVRFCLILNDFICNIRFRSSSVAILYLISVLIQGVYGYPIEIQALFFMALRCALLLLKQDQEGKEFMERIVKRLHALSYHMRNYFWLDLKQLNDIYRYKTEEYSHTAVNKFNVIPDSLPDWVFDFMPTRGGYFIGNVSPARMDFRWFCLGNCVAILSSLATPEQASAIMDLIESRWEELVGEMPLKICYPALESHEWRIVTGCDPKNTRWSYHNGGSWPACIKTGRPQIARRAIELAENRLSKDHWPEYYDGKVGRYIGKQARKLQTWSISGYLVAKMMLEDPSHLDESGNNLHSEKDLFDAATSYFTALFTTHGSSPAAEILENIAPVISKSMNASLTRPFTKEELKGAQVSRGAPSITHLLFADDCLIFGEASSQGAAITCDILSHYSRCSESDADKLDSSGVVVRDSNELVLGSCFIPALTVMSPFAAEALAALYGLRFALDLGCMHVVLESDSLTIISKLRSVVDDLFILRPYIADARLVSQAFASCQFAFTPRSRNEVAHCLTHLGQDSAVEMFWVEEVPPQAFALVQADLRCSESP